MRLRHPSGRTVHLICGISLMDARTPADAFAKLGPAATELRDGLTEAVASRDTAARKADAHGRLGVALRLPYPLAAALMDDGHARTRLRAELDARGLEVVTLSGGPDVEGGGLSPLPGWNDPLRLQHTLALARILVDLLPEDEVRGAISTCGLGRRDEWDEEHERAGARHLSRLSGGLADLAWRVGRAVRAGFLPEPGLVLDSPEDTVAALTRVDKDRLGICLDLTRVVRDWAAPEDGIDRLTDAGLSVITVRITDPAIAWQPLLRHLLAADAARTEYIEVDTPGSAAVHLAYVIGELTALGLAPEHEACAAER
jgi:sugar phosphate isomerase/epimerase